MAKSNATKLKDAIQKSNNMSYVAFIKEYGSDEVTSLANSEAGLDMLISMVTSCTISDSENSTSNRALLLGSAIELAYHRPDFLAQLKDCIAQLEEDIENA